MSASTPTAFNLANVLVILKKDLARAPRQGLVVLAFGYPVLLTLAVQLVFGQIFDPPPRIGLMDQGQSAIATTLLEAGSADVRRYEDPKVMWDDVTRGELDMAMVLPPDTDAVVKAGGKPAIEGHASTLANPQSLLKAEALFLRAFLDAGPELPVKVERVTLSTVKARAWTERLIPILILLTFFMAGTFLTGFALVDEKVRGTLKAMLTTPTSLLEILMAKAAFSYGMAMLCALITLSLNDAFSSLTASLGVAMTLAAIMTIQIGMILGLLSKDISGLYGAVKAMGPVMVLSTLPFVWDGFPQWIAKIIPTWYVIAPIMDIINTGATLADVWVDLLIASGFCVLFVIALKAVSTRTMARLDAVH